MKSIRHRLTLLIDTFGTVQKKKLLLFKFFMPGKRIKPKTNPLKFQRM